MLSISEFAKECQTTVKTVRHYDNIGLLKADYVSSETGYRYYRKKSVEKFLKIKTLKQSGFTLKEICEKFDGFDLKESINFLENKMLLLDAQQKMCLQIKKELEKVMSQSKKYMIIAQKDCFDIIKAETNEKLHINAQPNILAECCSIIDSSLNEEQLIGVDFDDLKAIINEKTAFSVKTTYTPNCNADEFEEFYVSSSEEKATALVLFFEASPDISHEKISDVLESFMISFSETADVLICANADGSEKGITVKCVCFK